MENSGLDKDIRKNALYSGLALGAVMFVLGLVAFYVIIATTSIWVMSLVPMLLSVIVPVLVAIVMSLDLRKKAGGYWSLKQATTGIFIMFIIAYAANTIARDMIFVKLVEPEMLQKTENAVINSTTAMMQKSGVEQTAIDSKTNDLRKRFEEQKNVSVGKTLMGIGTTIILIFVVALIFAAFLKKEPPLFDTVDTDPTT